MNEDLPNATAWKWRAGVSRCRCFACVLLVAAGQLPLSAVETLAAASPNAVLRMGFSSILFAGVNENDAKAAMKVWAQGIMVEHGVAIVPEPTVLNGMEEVESAVRNKLVDTVTLSTEEYWTLGGGRVFTNFILGVNGGQVTEEYLLLVHRDSSIGKIEDMRGRSLVFCRSPRTSLAPVWFETLLLRSGLGQTRQFCGRVSEGNKISQAVLPVFFRQADACVVTRRGFQTMIELNPQVGQRLKTLMTSPPMVPSGFFFRADYVGVPREEIIAEVKRVHSTLGGQQILTLFQCENLEVHPVSALDAALDLLATHKRLCGESNVAANSVPRASTDGKQAEGAK